MESIPRLHKRLKLLSAGDKRRREGGEGRREDEREGCIYSTCSEAMWVGGLVTGRQI